MSRQLALVFAGPAAQPCFDQLALEFGDQPTETLYQFMIERLLTEAFPIQSDYHIHIFSYMNENDFKAKMGDSWSHTPIQSLIEEGPLLSSIFDRMFEDQNTESLLIQQVGTMNLDEETIASWFAKIQPDTMLCGVGSDQHLLTIGLNACHRDLINEVNIQEPDILDLLDLRCDHYKKELAQLPVQQVPSNLSELSSFRESLPKEHFIAKKIDQLVLEKLETSSPDKTRTLQIQWDEPEVDDT